MENRHCYLFPHHRGLLRKLMHLETDLANIDDVTHDQLRAELSRLGDGSDRAILSIDGSTYIQTAVFGNGLVVEKREGGGEETHFHAVPRHPELPPAKPKPKRLWWQKLFAHDPDLTSECAFTLAEVQQIFADYLAGRTSDLPKQWDQGYCDR